MFPFRSQAYKQCKEREPPLYEALVFMLGRMGNTKEALDLMINQLKDVKKAIGFVQVISKTCSASFWRADFPFVHQAQDDNSLWDHLIDWSLKDADVISELLENIGGSVVDPAMLISRVRL